MHSHHMHREHQVSHRRVHHILKGEPAGAKHHHTGPHAHAFSKVTSKSAAQAHDGHVAGKKAPKRFAKGGRVTKGHHKGHQTNIAIVNPRPAPTPVPLPAGAGPGGPPMPPPGGPPGGPPGMPPPGMPMRARGGKVQHNIDGESTKADIKAWGKRASRNSYARGGMTAGAVSGEGRLEKAAIAKRKG